LGMLSIIFSALEEVQMISLKAFTSAEQLMYEITTCPGYLSLNALNKAAGALSAREHPAWRSGKRTFFSGQRILAVSAIKWTPAKPMISASVPAAFCDRPRLSPK